VMNRNHHTFIITSVINDIVLCVVLVGVSVIATYKSVVLVSGRIVSLFHQQVFQHPVRVFDRVFDRVSWGLGLSPFYLDQKGGTFYLDYIYACATAGWRRTTKP